MTDAVPASPVDPAPQSPAAPTDRPSRRAGRCASAWCLFLGLFALLLALDLGTKSRAFARVCADPVRLDRDALLAHPERDPIPRHDGAPLLPFGLLEAKLELNPGAVFGLGAGHRWFFVGFTFVALTTATVIFARSAATSRSLHAGLALIAAGGVGNLYDRIVYSRVRDFLHMLPDHRLPHGWMWPGTFNPELMPWVFNVADLLLLIGMLCVMRWLRRARAASPTPPA